MASIFQTELIVTLRFALWFLVICACAPCSEAAIGFGPPKEVDPGDFGQHGDQFLSKTVSTATDGEGHWVAAWSRSTHFGDWINGDAFRMFVTRSEDNGSSWTAPVPLDPDPPDRPRREELVPVVRYDGSGVWVLAFTYKQGTSDPNDGEYEVYFSRSTDVGATWSKPRPLNSDFKTDYRSDDYPMLECDGAGEFLAFWNAAAGPFPDNPDMFYCARSSDGGTTWSAPRRLFASDAQYGHGSGGVATDGKGTWGVMGSGYSFFRSLDNGATWSPPVLTLPSWNYCPSCYEGHAWTTESGPATQLKTDGAGVWIAIFSLYTDMGGYFTFPKSRLILVRSVDNGATWGPPYLVHLPDEVRGDINDVNPTLATDRGGNWVVTWQSGHVESVGYGYPISVFAALNTGLDPESEIMIARSSDNGVTWSKGAILNLDAEIDGQNVESCSFDILKYLDVAPIIETDGRGRWITLWWWAYTPFIRTVLPGEGRNFFVPGCGEVEISPKLARTPYVYMSISDNLDAKPGAARVSTTIPARLSPGESILAGITLKNTGQEYWTSLEGSKLALLSDPCGLWNDMYPRVNLDLGEVVAPGESKQFVFPLTAPQTPGVCPLEFRMVQEFGEFFGDKITIPIEIAPAPNAAGDWSTYE